MAQPASVRLVTQAQLTAALAGLNANATTFTASSPVMQWVIPHTLGRQPQVILYDVSGNEFLADVNATSTTVTVTFAAPVVGSAVLL